MKRTFTFLGWTFFGLFLVLGLLAWATLPPRVSLVLGAEEHASVESPETAHLQGVVLDLEERLEELESSFDAVLGELDRRADLAVRADGLASRNRDALSELRAQTAGLSRQADTLAQLLASLIAAREAAAPAAPAGSGAPLALEGASDPGSDLLADELVPEEEPIREDPVVVAPPEESEPVADGGVREAIGFSELLERKRWRLWDEPTTFRIVRPASQVGFEGSSTVHDFSGSTREISGSVRFVFADPSREPEATIVVDATTLDTQDEDRDEEMHAEHLESATYPKMTFTLTGVRDVRPDAGGSSLRATAAGVFEIHGREQAVELPVTVSKRLGRRILVEGDCPLKMSSFGIEPPTALAGVIKTSDNILVRIRLEAEAVKP